MSKNQPYGNVKMKGKKEMRLPCGCCTAVNKKKYSDEYDSFYCEEHNEWLEDTCTDTDCDYCKDRPEKPL